MVKRWTLTMMLLSLGVLGAVVPAAWAGKPTGDYTVFNDCPLTTTHLVACIYNLTSSGEVKIGSTAVPITNPLTFQGGLAYDAATESESFVGAADGNTLSETAETVPGGLLGIVAPAGWPEWLQNIFNEYINKGLTGVTATTELVGSPTYDFYNLAAAEGVGLTLPVRLHLSNAFLGGSCYIGSASEPVSFKLTTGATAPPLPNKTISGSPGSAEFLDEGEMVVARGSSAVDNSFSVPTASGCGGIFSLLVDPVIDLKLGLPSAAGNNTAILNGTLEQAKARAVRESEA